MKKCYMLLVIMLCAAAMIDARINIPPHRQNQVAPHRRPEYTTMPVDQQHELTAQEVPPHRRKQQVPPHRRDQFAPEQVAPHRR